MSHIVKIETQIRDVEALHAAARRMQLPPPRYEEIVQFFNSHAAGYAVCLRDWRYPVVCNVQTGQVALDNFDGRWGNQKELDRLFQNYAVEKALIEARKHGYSATEQQLEDGSIKVVVQIGGVS